MMLVPAETPVTIPLTLTVATDGVALFQVPPVILGVNVVVEPRQALGVPDNVGIGLTVTVTLTEQPEGAV